MQYRLCKYFCQCNTEPCIKGKHYKGKLVYRLEALHISRAVAVTEEGHYTLSQAYGYLYSHRANLLHRSLCGDGDITVGGHRVCEKNVCYRTEDYNRGGGYAYEDDRADYILLKSQLKGIEGYYAVTGPERHRQKIQAGNDV